MARTARRKHHKPVHRPGRNPPPVEETPEVDERQLELVPLEGLTCPDCKGQLYRPPDSGMGPVHDPENNPHRIRVEEEEAPSERSAPYAED